MRHLIRLAALVAAALVAPAAPRAADAPASPAPPAAAPAAATPGAPDAAAQEQLARQWREAFAREVDPLPQVAFETPGGFRGRVEAKEAPQVTDDGGEDVVVFSLGIGQPVTCTIVPERIDAGGTTWQLVDAVRRRETLTLVGARPVEIVAVKGSALVFSEIAYEQASAKGRLLGVVKNAVYAHATRSLFCQHDEPGYAKTFQRVVASLAASLESGDEDERERARYREIAVVRVQGVPTGFSEQVVWARDGGGRHLTAYEMQLLPRSPTDLVATDLLRAETSDADGLLLGGRYVHVTNGAVDRHVELTGGEAKKTARTFRYEGELQGKPLAGSFETKAGLATDFWFARRFAKAAAKPAKGEVRHEGYAFTANPAGAVVVSYRPGPTKGRTDVSVGPMHIAAELDEHGLLRSGEIPVGAATLVIERAWSSGTP